MGTLGSLGVVPISLVHFFMGMVAKGVLHQQHLQHW